MGVSVTRESYAAVSAGTPPGTDRAGDAQRVLAASRSWQPAWSAVARQMLSSTRTTGESWSTRCAPGERASVHSCLSEKLRQRLHAPPAHPPPDFQTVSLVLPPPNALRT